MKKTLMTFGVLLASATVVSAQSFQFEAARVGGEYQYYSESGFDLSSWEASLDASATFGADLGLQVGLGYLSEFASSDAFFPFQEITAFELHGFYDISDHSRLGLLYAYDTYNDGDSFFALEAVNTLGNLRGEGRFGYFSSSVEPAHLMEIKLGYGISDLITLSGNFQRIKYHNDNGFYRLWSFGAAADLSERAQIYVDYGWTRNDFGPGNGVYDGNLLSVGFSFAFAGDRDEMMFTYSPFF